MTNETPIRRPFTTGIAVMTLLFFGALPLLWMGRMLVGDNPPTLLAPIGIWFFFVSWLVLGTPILYTVVCSALLGLSIYTLYREKRRWWQQIILSSVVAGILAFMLWPYQPAVQPAAGYQLTLVTEPSLFANGLARSQAIGEHRPCHYEILGWHADSLYYQAQCTMQPNTVWYINPQQMTSVQRYQGDLPALQRATLTSTATWSMIHAVADYPPDTDLRSLYVPGSGMQSPDGKWTAMISKYLYSREDVILISQSQQGIK